MKRISIIIPTYKPGLYFKECLDSIKNQDRKDQILEVLVVLNGEKEDYLNKILSWVDDDRLFRLFYSSCPGVSNARNIGIEEARGDYVLFLDDDDFISPNFVHGLLSKVEEAGFSGSKIVVSKFLTYDDKSGNIGEDYVTTAYNKLKIEPKFNLLRYRGFLSSVCGKLIPRVMIAKSRFDPKVKISEDGLFMFRISKNIQEIILADQDIIYYRRLRSDSVLRAKKTSYFKVKLWVDSLRNYSLVYFSSPLEFSFMLFITRLLAVTKVYFCSILK